MSKRTRFIIVESMVEEHDSHYAIGRRYLAKSLVDSHDNNESLLTVNVSNNYTSIATIHDKLVRRAIFMNAEFRAYNKEIHKFIKRPIR